MARILLVEDDEMIASGLGYALEQEGYGVVHCTGLAGAREAMDGGFQLAVLDLSLPDGNGYELCGPLRDQGVPVIFLTAVDDEGNVVRGLEMGAEDYITKPFRLRELLARIAAVLRRNGGGPGSSPVIPIGDRIRVHTLQAKVTLDGGEIELTALEYRLLLVFANHKGQVLSRGQLLEGIWDVAGNFVTDNTLSVYVGRLREKLGDDRDNPRIIKTVRGLGYQLFE